MNHVRRPAHYALGALALLGLVSLSIPAAAALSPSEGPSPRASGLADSLSKTQQRSGDLPTIVLLHGAWADSGAWNAVARRLQSFGYTVDAVPNELRGLPIDSEYLADFLQSVSGPIVLVGHSYGGAVISNAATGNPNVKALVYVDAFIPKEGETIGELANQKPGSCLSGGGDPTKVFNFVTYPGAPEGDFDLYAKQAPDDPYPGFAACFANDMNPHRGAALGATARPLTLSTFGEASGPVAWNTIPSWAFVGTLDKVIVPAEQLFMAKRAHAHIMQFPASHLSMVSAPLQVAKLIYNAAHAVG